MKNIIKNGTYIITICILLIGCKQESPVQKGYTLSGTISGIPDIEIKLVEGDFIYEAEVISTSIIKGGTFEFSGQIDDAKIVSLVFQKKKEEDVFYYIPLILDKGKTTLTADVATYIEPVMDSNILVYPNITTSSSTTKDFQTYITARKDFMDSEKTRKYRAILTEYDSISKRTGEAPDDPLVDNAFTNLLATFEAAKKESIIQLSNSLAGIIILNNENLEIFSAAEMKMFLTHGKKNFNATPQFKVLEKNINKSINLVLGATAPQFTMENDKGGQTSLSEFKGQYVLVDFWAYWCKPCVETFPHLNELYSKYHDDGFEIVHISRDPNRAAWYKALKTHKNPWPQLIEKEEAEEEELVSYTYNVPYIPYFYLLDKEGKIIAKNLREEELDSRLKDIFGH
ncbi:TlpA disulfide reductase family protein [Flavivirga eckloniae]|uniref:Thioredoxin domain-containing protein n=1 Tax=Flavivirga eckloniae TaxID=1803846 RepID=A0A2K9PMW6_9FLAO|nr:TlpA disulfide reductase family protein [Flavivirga eckloniae]AUP77927.1 hypothetical protein C1H87_04050 [Flavivirga eckloniae]